VSRSERATKLESKSAGKHVAAGGTVGVNTTATGSERVVVAKKNTGPIHDLPSMVGRVVTDDKRIESLLEAGVEKLQAVGLLVGNGNLREVAAVDATIAPITIRRTTVERYRMPGQRAGIRV
jgi:hypothetical protein